MRAINFLVLLTLLLLAGTSARAQSLALAGGDYVLGLGDVIDISVLNHGDLNKTLTILPDGTITFPGVGQVRAAGKTTRALATEIQASLERTRNSVVVFVGVKEVQSRRVRLAGAVKMPNEYALRPGWRLLDLVAVAGGLNARPAHISGRIVRSGGEIVPLDLSEAIAQPQSDANPRLAVDDLVLLEEADPSRNTVHVMGQVTKPGAYPLGDEGISLLSLLSQAGNTTPSAALTRAYILRGNTEIPVNLRTLLAEGKTPGSNRALQLQAGDVLFVPEIEDRIAVMGQVNKPGYYSLPETRPLTALDALSLAGGQTQNGNLGRAGIIRMVAGKAQVIPIDIEKMLGRGDLQANVALQRDDVLFIPSRSDRRFEWKDVLGPLSALSFLGIRLGR